jgi:formate hydrogenlyase subunit 4
MNHFFYVFVYSVVGVIAVFVCSLFFEGIDRKLAARMQNRIGPPIIQPFFDFWKLCHKERIIPAAASPLFKLMPYLTVGFAFLGSILIVNAASFDMRVSGDLIIIVYLLAMPTLMLALGGYASGNPYGAMGASRSLLLLFAYKIPMITAVFLIAFKIGTFSLSEIIQFQNERGLPLLFTYPSIFFAGILYLVSIPAVVGVVPFDIAEAKTEIIYGSLIEYSGLYLALMRLSKSILCFALLYLASLLLFTFTLASQPIFQVFFSFVFALVLLVVTISIPRNLFARIKINQAYRFFRNISIILTTISIIFILVGY